MAFAFDASVAAAWVLPDEEAVRADIALDRLGEEIAKVPIIFRHELRNVLLTAERRGRITGGCADSSLTRLPRLPIRCPEDVEGCDVMALVRNHNLTAYDASYLTLAIREGCVLAGLDRRLNTAAAAEGVTNFVELPAACVQTPHIGVENR